MRKSILELIAQATADFPDNAAGLITPAKLRGWATDFLNAIAPAYGLLSKTTASSQTLGLVPVIVDLTTAYDSNSAETTSSAATNNITRAERGTSTINFSCDIETNNGRFITFTLYKGGVATTWRVTCNGAGNGNPVSVALTAVDYADPAAVYDFRATAEVNGTAVLISDVAFLVSVDPVRSFT